MTNGMCLVGIAVYIFNDKFYTWAHVTPIVSTAIPPNVMC
jgi:hypothetical protein